MVEHFGDVGFLAAAITTVGFLVALNYVPGQPWRDSWQGWALYIREIIGALVVLHIWAVSTFGQYVGWEWARLTLGWSKTASLIVFFILMFQKPKPTRGARRRARRELRARHAEERAARAADAEDDPVG